MKKSRESKIFVLLIFSAITMTGIISLIKFQGARAAVDSIFIAVRVPSVGLYEDGYSERIYEGGQELEYLFNNESLGVGDIGVHKLLKRLESISSAEIVNFSNPPIMGQKVQADQNYKYPYVKNKKLRNKINHQLDRLRGWSDSTPPQEP